MRILAISDVPEQLLYDNFDPQRWRSHADLIISCGDLDPRYLEYLVSELDVPLLYVAGNHDTGYREHPPEGCDDIDGRAVMIGGLHVAGIAGCLRYNAGPEAYQFSERQFSQRLRHLARGLRGARIDLMVSHAAPLHDDPLLDAPDPAHRSVVAFRQFALRHRPRFWLHGHNHLLDQRISRLSTLGETTVINVYGHYELDTDRPSAAPSIVTPASPQLRPS